MANICMPIYGHRAILGLIRPLSPLFCNILDSNRFETIFSFKLHLLAKLQGYTLSDTHFMSKIVEFLNRIGHN